MVNNCRLGLARLAHLNAWFWIAAVFGGQGVGALAVTHLFRIHLRETLLPILVLFLGMVLAGLLARRKSSDGLAAKLRWLPLVLYGLFIFLLSSRDYPDAQVNVNTDLFHLVEFSTLGLFLGCLWYPLIRRAGNVFFFAAVMVSGLLYAFSDEFHQSFVPGRTPSVIDLLYDTTALAVACTLFLVGVHLRMNLQRTMQTRELRRGNQWTCQQ